MIRKRLARLAAMGLAIAGATVAASAQVVPAVGDPQAGRDYALRNCTNCHMVSPQQSTPARAAPSFQAIANMHSTTEMSLHAFLSTPHPKMPNFIVPPRDAQDVTAYILSLRKRR